MKAQIKRMRNQMKKQEKYKLGMYASVVEKKLRSSL